MAIDLRALLFETLHLSPRRYAGEIVVVTGAGQGIGRQAAQAYALLGAHVVVAELAESGAAAAQEIVSEGGTATFVRTDVSDVAAVERLARATRDLPGDITTLVNNAIYIRECAVADMPVEMWDRILGTNLRGTFLTCRAFLPDLVRRGQATIVNMVSTDAMPGLSAYIASKQGIVGFSQSLAQEVGEAGVRVIAFAPGMVDTPGLRSIADGLAPRLGLSAAGFLSLSLHAGYSGLMPTEHAAAALAFLTSALADEFKGQTVNGYDILERAGVLKPSETPTATGEPDPAQTQEARYLLIALADILAETEAELNRFPIFVRPLARQGFKSKAGQSLSDWRRQVAALEAGSIATPSTWSTQLERLVGYFRDVPKETSRFTRDADVLGEVLATSNRRVALINSLLEACRSQATTT